MVQVDAYKTMHVVWATAHIIGFRQSDPCRNGNVHGNRATATFVNGRGFTYGNLCPQLRAAVLLMTIDIAFGERRQTELKRAEVSLRA